MKEKFDRVVNSVKHTAEKASQTVSDIVESDTAKAAIKWSKEAAATAADEAGRIGKEVARSDMVKDAATGAALGAAIAVPIPIIGPAVGAVVGAGLGMYKNAKSPAKPVQAKAESRLEHTPADLYDELLKLDELHKKGILTDEEFAIQKKKVLNGTK